MAALGSSRARPTKTTGAATATANRSAARRALQHCRTQGEHNKSWRWRRRRQQENPLKGWPPIRCLPSWLLLLFIMLIAPLALLASGQDLDNSIRQDRPPTLVTTITDANNRDDQTGHILATLDTDNSLAPGWLANRGREDEREAGARHEQHHHDRQQVLERRIDWLEFAMRKSMHQMHLAGLLRPADSQPTAGEEQQSGLGAQWAASFLERLEHIEKYVAVVSAKLYETEKQVKRLARCECRLSCKWSPPAGFADKTPTAQVEPDERAEAATAEEAEEPAATSTTSADREEAAGQNSKRGRLERRPADDSNTTTSWLLKADGQVWQSKCDVCSCHRGKVRCRYMSCPAPKCEDPQHLAGKCCPVCYKPCVYKRQTVRHGNKLVINSGQDTCKECMCIDGRFKCQRVEVERSAPRLTPATEANGSGSLSVRRQRSTPIEPHELLGVAESSPEDPSSARRSSDEPEDEADYAEEAGDADLANYERQRRRQSGRNRYRRHHQAGGLSKADRLEQQQRQQPALLVCPQLECKLEEQVRLENDCCTYCQNFDFCAYKSWHRCHPDASCSNNLSAAIAQAKLDTRTQHSNGRPLLLKLSHWSSSPFSCRCKAGFEGDGRHCRDIDECAAHKLNACDPKTSVCVNLAGGYECKCKRGFQLDKSSNSSQEPAKTAETPTSGGPIESRAKCVDVNECADDKLNKCHLNAKCINSRGSYKCKCKRGYLGDGFECHKWFSSAPDVAAYLHRHAEVQVIDTGARSSSQQRSNANNLQPLGDDEESEENASKTRPPTLEGVPDADTDDHHHDHAPRGSSEDLEEKEAAETDEHEDEQEQGEWKKPPKLSESKWEPLKLDGSLQQKPDTTQPAPNEPLQTTAGNPPKASDKANSVARYQENEPVLNTRTMLFQPPPLVPGPRWWEQEQAQPRQQSQTGNATSASSSSRLVGGGQTAKINSNSQQQTSANTSQLVGHGRNDNGATNYGKSDTNDPVYIQRSSKTVYQPFEQKQTTTTSLVSNNNGNPSQATASSQPSLGSITLPNSTSSNNNSTPGFKRATIITSATSSPTRGHGHWMAQSSSVRYPNSRALGVTASSAGPPQQPNIKTFSRSHLTHIILIISLIHFYCIDLNHVVTFYFN